MKNGLKSTLSLLLCLLVLASAGCETGRDHYMDDWDDDEKTKVTTKDRTPADSTGSSDTTAVGTTGSVDVTTPGTSVDPTVPVIETESERFDRFMKDLFINEISLDTTSLHFSVKDPARYGLENMAPKWYTPEEEDKYPLDDIIRELESFNTSALTAAQAADHKVLLSYCKLSQKLSDEKYDYLNSDINLGSGIQANLPTILSEYEFECEKDLTDYIALLKLVPDFVSMTLDGEDERVAKGYGYADQVLDQILDQITAISHGGDDFYLYKVVHDKIDSMSGLSASKKSDCKKQVDDGIRNYLIPAFADMEKRVEGYKGKGEKNKGLAGFKNGKEYYNLLCNQASDTNYTCDEMIKILDDDYEALSSQLMTILFSNMDLYQGFISGNVLPAQKGGTEIIDYLRSVLDQHFPAISGDSYELSYLSEEMESVMSGVLAYYVTPQVDSYLHGRIRINGGTQDESGLYHTLAHEGFPGHMYQFVYYYSQNPSDMRKILSFNGYQEGWAVYAANYAFGLTTYGGNDEAAAALSVINDRLNWNISCRIDLGIHYEGWTVSQLQNYLSSKGYGVMDVTDLYYSMVGNPAVYHRYYMGYLEFRKMYDYASAELGAKFDPIAFHKAMLDPGPCQLEYVWESVEKYVADNR